MKTLLASLLVAFALLVAFDNGPAAALDARAAAAPPLRSYDWAGYQAVSTIAEYGHVEADWTVPAITCPATGNRYVRIWAGVGGVVAGDALLRVGTAMSCRSGAASYSGFWEQIPGDGPHTVPDAVLPLDDVVVNISSFTGTAEFTFENFARSWPGADSAKWTERISVPFVQGVRKSAECIVERTTVGGQPAKLADFGAVRFAFLPISEGSALYGCIFSGNAAIRPALAGGPPPAGISVSALRMITTAGKLLATTVPEPFTGGFTVRFKASSN